MAGADGNPPSAMPPSLNTPLGRSTSNVEFVFPADPATTTMELFFLLHLRDKSAHNSEDAHSSVFLWQDRHELKVLLRQRNRIPPMLRENY